MRPPARSEIGAGSVRARRLACPALVVCVVALSPAVGATGMERATYAGGEPAAGTTFRDTLADGGDCPHCPLLVVVPAGAFLMGSPTTEQPRHGNEGPRHAVDIARPFAIGVTEVTFDQWDACVDAGACTHRGADDGWGRADRPAVNLSWTDTRQYLGWLSEITGRRYRLPSEAEWEYAARAGTATAYYWGDTTGVGNTVCQSCGSEWDNLSTAPVASFPPNPWGLFDVLGNAWEWTADCWNPTHAGAPADGSARLDGDCTGRVMRGGSWSNFPYNIRSAVRMRGVVGNRYLSKGFRVLAEL